MFSKLCSPRWPLVAAAMLALVLAYPAQAAAAHFGGGHIGGFHGARFGGFHGGAYRGFGYGGFGRGYYGGFGRGYYGGFGRGYYGYRPYGYGGYGYGYYPNYLNVYPPYSYYPSTSLYLNATPPAVVVDPYVAVKPANTALITVDVPPNAQIMFNGTKTSSTGPERRFESPALTPDQHYSYEVRAQWTGEDGRSVTQTRTVDVKAGANIHLTFPLAQARTTGQAETSEQPEGK